MVAAIFAQTPHYVVRRIHAMSDLESLGSLLEARPPPATPSQHSVSSLLVDRGGEEAAEDLLDALPPARSLPLCPPPSPPSPFPSPPRFSNHALLLPTVLLRPIPSDYIARPLCPVFPRRLPPSPDGEPCSFSPGTKTVPISFALQVVVVDLPGQRVQAGTTQASEALATGAVAVG